MSNEQATSQGGLTYQEKLIILPAVQDMEKPMTITAYEAEGTGLAYNAVGGDESEGWVITHLESKKVLCSPVDTEHEVKMLMEKVVPITDWNTPEKELAKKTEVGAKFRDCKTSVRHDLNTQLETAMKDAGMPDYLIEEVMDELEEDDLLRSALLYAFKIVS